MFWSRWASCTNSPLHPSSPTSCLGQGTPHSVGSTNHPATFSLEVTVWASPLSLTWLSVTPVWVNQHPLKKERLEKLPELVQQLEAGHIEPSHGILLFSWFPGKQGNGDLYMILEKFMKSYNPWEPFSQAFQIQHVYQKNGLLWLLT